ncbi:hypothetical protein Tsubulata_050492 [Turnera subulata]|uniref:MPN domain-containing protein n=1 Tax=Turnera subulata TaxID=218843 RepID=A0A9Q0F840_9ROSI|nr:hypothetical protein Tsubulata_050492 [Turnera subulata]
MSLTGVKMSEDVWLTCLTHALSTETEEIMGLLLGDIQHRMTTSTGRTTRVIGWYHSHPHITVFPSHVDVRTQGMYQLLDPGFIGLIFSCFSEDVNKVGRIQVIAFQSSDGKHNTFSLSPANRSSIIEVESSLSSSECTSAKLGTALVASNELDTGDSRSVATSSKGGTRSLELGDFFANADANYVGRDRTSGNSDNVIDDIDPMDMSESMQEAMHRSNLDMSGAQYVRKEIPLEVLPTYSLLKLDAPLTSFTDLQRVLYEEERGAYNQAISQNIRNEKVHPLTFIHHTATYQASMCKLMEYCLSPAINALQGRLRENEIRLAMLSDEAKFLEAEGLRGNELTSRSPRKVSSPGLRGSNPFGQKELHGSPQSVSPRTISNSGGRHRTGSS